MDNLSIEQNITEYGFKPVTLQPTNEIPTKSNQPQSSITSSSSNDSMETSQETGFNCSERLGSGESVFKTFFFEPSKDFTETEKCIAFWKQIKSLQNIKPAPCKMREDPINSNLIKKRDEEIQTEGDDAIPFTSKNCPWYWAYLEVLKKDLLKQSKSASRGNNCKLCSHDITEVDKETIDCLISNEEREKLDDWDPKRKILADKEIGNIKDDIFVSRKVSAATSSQLLNPPPGLKRIVPRPASNKPIRIIGRKNKLVNTDSEIIKDIKPEMSVIEKKVSFYEGPLGDYLSFARYFGKPSGSILKIRDKGPKIIRKDGRYIVSEPSVISGKEEIEEEVEEEEGLDETEKKSPSVLEILGFESSEAKKILGTDKSTICEGNKVESQYCIICGLKECYCLDNTA